jgi:hypothetical protein
MVVLATGQPWTWAWGYPGVWLFVALLAVLYLRGIRRAAEPRPPRPPSLLRRPPHRLLALDWPIGPLGTGYLIASTPSATSS